MKTLGPLLMGRLVVRLITSWQREDGKQVYWMSSVSGELTVIKGETVPN
jgi:hypothetical protein